MPLARLLLLLMAAGLPLAISFSLAVDPLAPKVALWTAAGGLLLAIPTPPLGFSRPAGLLLVLAAALSFITPSRSADILPYLVGFAVYTRARQNAWSGDFTRKYAFLTVAGKDWMGDKVEGKVKMVLDGDTWRFAEEDLETVW